MGSNYVSPAEQTYREERQARNAELDVHIKEKNKRLIGELKGYMGVTYQLRQDGMYVCTNLPKGCPLGEVYNSERVLKKCIDDLGFSIK
jgi:DNA-binding transcriptional MocR family regulator